jgi:hypothetical protein
MTILSGLRVTDYKSNDHDVLIEVINTSRPYVRPTPYSDTSLSCDRWHIAVNDNRVNVLDKVNSVNRFGMMWQLQCSITLDENTDLDSAIAYCKANVK